jgi:hypothetical protein
MKPLFDALLFLVWVAVYLTAVFWIAHYRKTKVHALGPALPTEYRTDKDIALRLLIFVMGVVMLLLGYVATRVVSQYF